MNIANFPRNGLIWLLLSVSIVYLPLQVHLPLWTLLVFVVVFTWRWLMHLGRFPYPSKMVKVLVVVVGVGSVLISSQGRFHLESATTFIVVVSLLKVLEMKNQRDGYIVIFLSLFLIAVNFIYSQGILTALYSLLSVWILISALISLHQTQFSDKNTKTQVSIAGKTSAKVLLLSLPIMLILFVLFPRINPIWSLNLQSGNAKTGLSENMRPGDIAELSNSDELVFRVTFDSAANKDIILSAGKGIDKNPPAVSDLYWRALILDQYKISGGQSEWSSSNRFNQVNWSTSNNPASQSNNQSQPYYEYTIIQEATDKKWLLGLRGIEAIEPKTGITEDDRLVSREQLFQRKEYRVRSWPQQLKQPDQLPTLERQQNLQVAEGNPKTQLLAQQISTQYDNDLERIEAVLSHYQQQPFIYTLKPQRMGSNDIDDFLFDKQAGFCAHYSSSFSFIMRQMGIPARIVAGYQGGEYNEDSGHFTIRQYDAHAWVEVWLDGLGWKRYDPTALVAPDRITQGIRDALSKSNEYINTGGLPVLRSINWPALTNIRMKMDELNYYWHQTVLNFNKKQQRNSFKEWFGNNFFKKAMYVLIGLFISTFSLMAIFILFNKSTKKQDLIDKSLSKLSKLLSTHDLQIREYEGLEDYSQRLQRERPMHKDSIRPILLQLQNYYYSGNGQRKRASKKTEFVEL